MAVAMAAIFVVALTIPEAWHDAPGGLNGPLVLVGAYLLVRCVHLSLYAVAATGDPGLRRQVARTWPPTLAGGALLVAGALLGGWTETLLFAAALLVEGVGVYLTSRRGNWRLHSVARVDLAVEAYTYGHFPLVAGIVLAALGVEGVLAHAGERQPLGTFYALPLFGGVAVYLAGQVLFKRRMHSTLSVPRLVATGVLVAALPACGAQTGFAP